MMEINLQLFGGRGSSGGKRSTGGGGSTVETIESYGGLSGFIRRFPYSEQSNPIDNSLRDSIETSAKNFDPNISPYYSRKENVVSVGFAPSPTGGKYDLSAKSGNDFKSLIKGKIEAQGLSVEAMGKKKVGGVPEYWFRLGR